MGVVQSFWRTCRKGQRVVRREAGQALVEVLVAIGITGILLPAIATAVVATREGRAQGERRLQAAALLRETNEAVRSMREKGWASFAVNGTYYPTISGGTWALTAGSQTTNGLTRQVVISDAQRNSSGAIVASGGTVDPSTKKVVATVSWTTPLSGSLSNEAYLNRYLNNTAWSQTTQADFTAGTTNSTSVTSTGGGQVELASSGGISHLQSAITFSNSASTTIAQAFSSNVTGGSLIVAAVSWDTVSTTTVTCSDSQGNTYTTATNNNDTTNTQALAICYAPNAAGGATTVTATFGASSTTLRLAVHEYRGVAATSPVDVSSMNVANGTTATDNITSNAATTTVGGDLIFGAVMETAASTTTINAGTGFTRRQITQNELATQDRIQAAAGSVASTQTFTTALRYTAHMVAFKASTTSTPWVAPNIVGSADTAGTEDALDVFVSGNYAYVADATILRIYDISNPAVPSQTGSYTAAGNINGIYVVGDYAYIATASTSSEFRVVNVSNKASPTQAATLDVTGTAAANAVYVDGSFAYLGRANNTTAGTNELVIINIATPTAPTTSGSINLSNAVNGVYVSGNFAYLATSITTAELTIINISNKASPTSAGVYEASGTSIATDVFGNGTTIYLAKANNTSGAEFFILNAANAASVTLTGSYEAGANLNGVHASGTNIYLATAVTNAQFRVLNITTPATPTLTGSLNLGAVGNDVFYDGTNAYVATAHDTRELAIVRSSAPVVSGYATSGTFSSSSFDAGASAAYNYITFTLTEPASTDIRFQIAVNSDNTTWNYVGPDGTGSTYYSSPGSVRLGTVGRYVRYQATFTGPGTSTPIMSDVTMNYSP
jgi:type II secretory pathway pseudopilin PulG